MMKLIIGIILVGISLWTGSAIISLLLGIVFSLSLSLPNDFFTKSAGTKFLQVGIVTLGLTISLTKAFALTGGYLPYISLLVVTVFFGGIYIGKLIGVDKKLTLLIVSGAAICGGTAIAAVAPIIKAKPKDVLTAITIIFLLNAVAIVVFPVFGNYIGMGQDQFGAWAAMSIHDTSSVIGAAMLFGEDAVETAATLKLGRTLWLIPLVIYLSSQYHDKKSTNIKLPIFVLFFIAAILLGTYLNFNEQNLTYLKLASQSFLLVGLFCIGTQINKESLGSISSKSLVLALILWALVIPSSYFMIMTII